MEKKRDIKQFGLRLEPKLKSWLRERAYDNRRSLNSEIELRLEQSRDREIKEAA